LSPTAWGTRFAALRQMIRGPPHRLGSPTESGPSDGPEFAALVPPPRDPAARNTPGVTNVKSLFVGGCRRAHLGPVN